jgi:hypothetical protein
MKFPLSAAPLSMGLGAGFVAAVYAIGAEMHYVGALARVLLSIGAVAGIVSSFTWTGWADDLQTRCERYEQVLREHGISPLDAR